MAGPRQGRRGRRGGDGRPQTLGTVLVNLIDNALRYAAGRRHPGQCRQVVDRVLINVVDQGPGVPRDTGTRCSAAFSDSGPHQQVGSVSGCRWPTGFVEAMGGSISTTDTPAVGCGNRRPWRNIRGG